MRGKLPLFAWVVAPEVVAGWKHLLVGPAEPSSVLSHRPLKSGVCQEPEKPLCPLLARGATVLPQFLFAAADSPGKQNGGVRAP